MFFVIEKVSLNLDHCCDLKANTKQHNLLMLMVEHLW